MLYRLSYFRNFFEIPGFSAAPRQCKSTSIALDLHENSAFQSKSPIRLFRASGGRRWIRTTEGINQQIYSLPHLATLVFSQNSLRTFEPMEGIEPTTPRLQITCSGQLSYIGNVVFPCLEHYFLKGIAKVDIIFNSPKLFRLF